MENHDSLKILVTGGTGYIGSHTVVELVEHGYEPVILDDLSRSSYKMLDRMENLIGKRPIFHQVDCKDRREVHAVLKEHPDIKGVIHFAAFKAVGESVEKPLEYYENNVGSQVTILKTMEEMGVKEFVFSSSCTVYGQPEELPVTEETPVQKPDSPYGETKKVCEDLMKGMNRTNRGGNMISLRYFNPIGAHPSGMIGEMPIDKPNNLAPFINQTAAGIRDELTIHGSDYSTRDGTCIRDYIHVVDLARAHVKALEFTDRKKEKQSLDIFNIGTGQGATVKEAIDAFQEANDVEVPHKYGPRRPGDVEQIWADTSKAEKELGWKAEYDLKDMMRHGWEWQKRLMEE